MQVYRGHWDYAAFGSTCRCIEDTGTESFGGNPAVQVQRCFTSTETVRIIRDGEHRTATSTFTLLLSSDVDLLNMRLLMEVEGQQPKWST